MKLIQCQSPPTEWYYFLNYGKKMVAKQYEWLVADLEAADREENRSKRPWVVLMGHRPMYCSGMNGFLCHFIANITEIVCVHCTILLLFTIHAILRMDYLR